MSVRERELEKGLAVTNCESRLVGKTVRVKRGWSEIRHWPSYAMEGNMDS